MGKAPGNLCGVFALVRVLQLGVYQPLERTLVAVLMWMRMIVTMIVNMLVSVRMRMTMIVLMGSARPRLPTPGPPQHPGGHGDDHHG